MDHLAVVSVVRWRSHCAAGRRGLVAVVPDATHPTTATGGARGLRSGGGGGERVPVVGGAALLEQPLELRLEDLPALRVLRRDLEGHREAVRVEAVVEGDQGSVHAGLDQVVSVFLEAMVLIVGHGEMCRKRLGKAVLFKLL